MPNDPTADPAAAGPGGRPDGTGSGTDPKDDPSGPAAHASVDAITYDPKTVDPKLKPFLDREMKELKAKATQSWQEAGKQKKMAEIGAQVMRDPQYAKMVSETVARHHGRADLLAPAKADTTEEEIPDDVLNDKVRFKDWVQSQVKSGVEEGTRDFRSQLAQKDQQLRNLEITARKSEYPMASQYEAEISEAMASYNLPFEKAYDMVTVQERVTEAKDKVTVEQRETVREALQDEVEMPLMDSLPPEATDGLELSENAGLQEIFDKVTAKSESQEAPA